MYYVYCIKENCPIGLCVEPKAFFRDVLLDRLVDPEGWEVPPYLDPRRQQRRQIRKKEEVRNSQKSTVLLIVI